MAYANTTRTAASSWAEKIANLRADVTEALAKRRVYRTTVAELNQLSNRELADLGIARSAIRGIATEAAYGK